MKLNLVSLELLKKTSWLTLYFCLALSSFANAKNVSQILKKYKINPNHIGIEIAQGQKTIFSLNENKKFIPNPSISKFIPKC